MPYNQQKKKKKEEVVVMHDGKTWGIAKVRLKLLWPEHLVKHQSSVYFRQRLTKLIPDISLNSWVVGFKLQGRFLTQASWGSIHKHGVYFVTDVLERLNSSLIFFVLCGHLFTFENVPADPRLSEKAICSHGGAQSPISMALRIEYKFSYCWFFF